MELSRSTRELLALIVTFSGNRLTRQNDLGALIEVAHRTGRTTALDELSFHAKFISKSYGIMKRIGKDGEGYDKLLDEFNTSLAKARTLTSTLLGDATADVETRFAATYLAMTAEALQNFLALLYDLSWYKNWLIDKAPGRA